MPGLYRSSGAPKTGCNRNAGWLFAPRECSGCAEVVHNKETADKKKKFFEANGEWTRPELIGGSIDEIPGTRMANPLMVTDEFASPLRGARDVSRYLNQPVFVRICNRSGFVNYLELTTELARPDIRSLSLFRSYNQHLGEYAKLPLRGYTVR